MPVQQQAPFYTEANKGLRRFLANTEADYNASLAAFHRVMGKPNAAQTREQQAAVAAAQLKDPTIQAAVGDVRNVYAPGDIPQTLRNFGNYATGVVSENLPLMGLMAATGLTGGRVAKALGAGARGTKAAGMVTGALPYESSAVGQTYRAIRNDPNATGTPEEQARTAIGYGTGQMLMGMAPVAGVLERAVAPGVSRLARMGQAAGIGGVGEAVTETGEQVLQRAAQQRHNPNVSLTDDEAIGEYLNAAAGGALFGTAGGGLAGGVAPNTSLPGVDVLNRYGLGKAARQAVREGTKTGQTPVQALQAFTRQHGGLLPPQGLAELQSALRMPHSASQEISESELDDEINRILAQDELDMQYMRISGADMAGNQAATQAYEDDVRGVAERILTGQLAPESPEARAYWSQDPDTLERMIGELAASQQGQDMIMERRSALAQSMRPELRQIADQDNELVNLLRQRESRRLYEDENGRVQRENAIAAEDMAADLAPDETAEPRLSLAGEQQSLFESLQESPQSSEYVFNAAGLPWKSGVNEKTGTAHDETALTKALREDLSLEDQDRMVKWLRESKNPRRTREALNAQLKERGRFRLASLREAINSQGDGTRAYELQRAKELFRNESEDVRKQFTSLDDYMDRTTVLKRDRRGSATGPEDTLTLTKDNLFGAPLDILAASRVTEINNELKALKQAHVAKETSVVRPELRELAAEVHNIRTRLAVKALSRETRHELNKRLKQLYAMHPELSQFSVTQAKDGEFGAGMYALEQERWGIKNSRKPILVPTSQDQAGMQQKKRIPVVVTDHATGKKTHYNIDPAQLINTYQNRVYDDAISYNQENQTQTLANRLFAGLAEVLGNREVDVRLAKGKIDPNTIVYASRTGGKITFGELASTPGIERLNTQLGRLETRLWEAKNSEDINQIKREIERTKNEISIRKSNSDVDLAQGKDRATTGDQGQFDRQTTEEITGKEIGGNPEIDKVAEREKGEVPKNRAGRVADVGPKPNTPVETTQVYPVKAAQVPHAATTQKAGQRRADVIKSEISNRIGKLQAALKKAQAELAQAWKERRFAQIWSSEITIDRLSNEIAQLRKHQEQARSTRVKPQEGAKRVKPGDATGYVNQRAKASDADLETAEALAEADLTGIDFAKFDLDEKQQKSLFQALKAEKNTSHDLEREQKLAQAWTDKLGMGFKVQVVGTRKALMILSARGKKLDSATAFGFSHKDEASGEYTIYINPLIKGAARTEILGHELGHAVMHEALHLADTATKRAIVAAYNRWRASLGKDPTYNEVILSRLTANVLGNIDLSWGVDKNIKDMERGEYYLSFNEWFADNVSKWLNTDAKPRGVVQEFFHHVATLLRDLAEAMGLNTPDKAISDMLDSMWRNKSLETSSDTSYEVNQQRETSADRAWQDGLDAEAKDVHDLMEVETEGVIPDDLLERVQEMLRRTIGKEGVRVQSGKTRLSAAKDTVLLAAVLDGRTYGRAANAALRYAFSDPNLMTREEKRTIQRIFTKAPVMRQLRRLLEMDPTALDEIESSPEAAAAYGYQFWLAGMLNVSPSTENIFRKILNWVQDTLGIIREHENGVKILRAFDSGRLLQRSRGMEEFVVENRVNETLVQRSRKAVEKASSMVTPLLGKLTLSAIDQMKATKNPWLVQLGKQLWNEAGTEGEKESFIAARNRQRGRWTDKMHHIFDGQDDAFGESVVRILNGETEPRTRKEAETVAKVYGLLEEMYKYMREAGVLIPDISEERTLSAGGFTAKVKNYFPRLLSNEYLQQHHDEFINMLLDSKYREQVPDVDAAERIYQAYTRNYGDEETAHDELLKEMEEGPQEEKGTGNPKAGSVEARTFKWIEQKDLAPYLSHDLGLVLSTYINQMTKRAEYARRFSRNNKGGLSVKEYLAKAAATGATEAQIVQARKVVQAVLGTLGSDIDPALQKFQGAILVYQNWTLLALSLLSSLVDPLGIAVRGDLDSAWAAARAGIREAVAKLEGDRTALRELAEGLGTIEQRGALEALGYEYGGYYVTGKARQWNDRLFRLNGMQGWTRFTRLMALAGAETFIAKHGRLEEKHSQRFLDQLGLRKGDVQYTPDGKLMILNHAQREALREKIHKTPAQGQDIQAKQEARAAQRELNRDERVRAALNRWVDEAILRPDASQRPVWGSDPRWMLVFHLKAFTYAFQERILKRVFKELGHSNWAPALSLLGYVPVMMGADAIRHMIQGKDDDDDDKRTFLGDVDVSMQRNGFYGVLQFFRDALKDVRYGHTGFEGLSGPSAEQSSGLLDAIEGSDGAKMKAFFRALPLQNVYKDWGRDL